MLSEGRTRPGADSRQRPLQRSQIRRLDPKSMLVQVRRPHVWTLDRRALDHGRALASAIRRRLSCRAATAPSISCCACGTPCGDTSSRRRRPAPAWRSRQSLRRCRPPATLGNPLARAHTDAARWRSRSTR